jgi:hypothetical protein
MQLHDWLKQSKFSVKRFAREVQVERAMVYRYFAGAVPRVSTIRHIEAITNGAVTARDFYDNAMQRRLDVSASGEWSDCGKPSPHPPKPESDEATAQERGYDEVSRLAS